MSSPNTKEYVISKMRVLKDFDALPSERDCRRKIRRHLLSLKTEEAVDRRIRIIMQLRFNEEVRREAALAEADNKTSSKKSKKK